VSDHPDHQAGVSGWTVVRETIVLILLIGLIPTILIPLIWVLSEGIVLLAGAVGA
jgi:hypothetical protein